MRMRFLAAVSMAAVILAACGAALADCDHYFDGTLGDVFPDDTRPLVYEQLGGQKGAKKHNVQHPCWNTYICLKCGYLKKAYRTYYTYEEDHAFSGGVCTKCGYRQKSSSSGSAPSGGSSQAGSAYRAATVSFGRYEQDGDFLNGSEPIEWFVVDRSGDKVLLVSVYCLDAAAFNTELGRISWQNSSLRAWLNSAFYSEAFSAAEQGSICTMEQPSDRNRIHNTSWNETTRDPVFILSATEAESYFPVKGDRKGLLTQYAVRRGAASSAWYWLRTAGNQWGRAANISSTGSVDFNGSDIRYTKYAVRPAVWVEADAVR